LASRRKSMAQPTTRRTSNFLELPLSDYEMRQRRYCSLPESAYNPRHLPNELYRLRSFSIKANGSVVKHGDQIATRRKSRSSAGSTTNTSRNNSQVSSRDVSPKTKSPTDSYFNFQSGTNSSLKSNKSSDDTSNHSTNNITDIEVYDYDADMDVEHNTFRICVLGETGVGKTALVNQFLTSEHMNTYDSSLDDEYGERSVSVSLDGDESELIFIDHAAGEMSTENTLSTYEPCACVVIYSIIDLQSFKIAEETMSYLWRFGYSKAKSVILVGNKVDLERSRIISTEEGRALARSCEAKFIETSAGIEHNVDELLVGVLKQIRLRVEYEKMSASRSASTKRNKKDSDSTEPTNTENGSSAPIFKRGSGNRRLSSPLRTLQAARDILTRVCVKSNKTRPLDCENLHIL